MTYLKLNFKPDKDKYVLTTYFVESTIPLKDAANHIAAESSVGTWTKVSTSNTKLMDRLGAKVYKIKKLSKSKAIMCIAYPVELFEANNIPQMLSDIAGNIYGMGEIKNLRFLDFHIPKSYLRTFKGPLFGMEKIRAMVGTRRNRRPHTGTIVKPKVGLSPKKTAEVAYQAWSGGLDLVKDDENLTNQKFCRFNDRIVHVLEAKSRAEEETGETKIYTPNITSNYNTMLKRADYVKDHGGNFVMVDIVVAGFSALQALREQKILPIHAHRAMHAAFTRSDHTHGMSMLILAKLARLAGVDQLHIGAAVGKMEGKAKEIREIHEAINKKWGTLKPVFSVASGGLHPGKIYGVYNAYGSTDFTFQAGGGIHGHPGGTKKGAMAMRQAADALSKRIPLRTYAKTHKELFDALKQWGTTTASTKYYSSG